MTTTRYTAATAADRAEYRHGIARVAALRAAAEAADYRAALAEVDAPAAEAESTATDAPEVDAYRAAPLATAPGPLAVALATGYARAIVDGAATAPGGGSITTTGAPVPGAGYVVGGVVPSLVTEAAPTADEVTAWILATDAHRAGVLGWWVDTDTGRTYVDASDVVSGRAAALELATARGELAVWDLAAAAEVRTDAARV